MSKQLGRQPVRQTQRRERREEMRRHDQAQLVTKRKRNRMIAIIVGCVAVIGSVIAVMAFVGNSPSSSNANNSSQLAPAVGGVQCNQTEQLVYHTHAHLSIYINGQNILLPAQIGITNTCIYWLHTHDASGIIHIESPQNTIFTLGTFFQLWREQFPQLQYQNQLSSTAGWQVYIDGKPSTSDFNTIELKPHSLITLAYNSPNITPDTTYNWGTL